MKSFAIVSLFMSVALAQSSSVIPSGISGSCTDFLQQLDSDQSLQTCTNTLTTATAKFGPNSSASSGDVNSALSQLCTADSACSETSIRTTLANFYAACTPELTSNLNQGVLKIYDTLYTLVPLTQASCSKDDAGRFCATQVQGNAPSVSSLVSGSDQQVLTPNFDALKSSNAAFLFLTSDLSSDKLCTPCTRSIMTSYISFESNIAYAAGLSNSLLLAGQTDLYGQISKVCGASFMNNAVQAAGSLSDSIISANAAPRSIGSSPGAIVSLLGAVTVALAAGL